jgi:predicted HTH domain antitoxin
VLLQVVDGSHPLRGEQRLPWAFAWSRLRVMTTISFELPDEAVLSMHVPPTEVERELRMAAAVKLYELGRLSSGAAARLAGIPRVAFLAKLADYGVDTFRMSEEELVADLSHA